MAGGSNMSPDQAPGVQPPKWIDTPPLQPLAHYAMDLIAAESITLDAAQAVRLLATEPIDCWLSWGHPAWLFNGGLTLFLYAGVFHLSVVPA